MSQKKSLVLSLTMALAASCSSESTPGPNPVPDAAIEALPPQPDGGCPPKDAPVQPPQCVGEAGPPAPDAGPKPPDGAPPPDVTPPPPDVTPPPPDGFACPPPDAAIIPPQCRDGGATDATPPSEGGSGVDAGPALTAYFYQDVGMGINHIYAGTTSDGYTVSPYFVSVMQFDTQGADIDPYGDPVFSRLANGRWAMTATTGMDHPQGAGQLLYHEAACPAVVKNDMVLLKPTTGTGCTSSSIVSLGKRSVITATDDGSYVLLVNDGVGVNLLKIGTSSSSATALGGICKLASTPTSVASMRVGDAHQVIKASATGLNLSDTGIARRTDGTWVMFVKGIPTNSGCQPLTACELCARGIYRATSTDLLTWSALERVVDKASVPEAGNGPDGKVWLYYQDFTEVCATGDLSKGARAPIAAVYEGTGGTLSTAKAVTFPGEAFETNTSLHYPTNGNPVALPDEAARKSLETCLGK